MPSKYKIIMEMASQTARDVTSNAERFTDFLVTAANNYKYSFKEQLLIHAQKPDATACAEIETWNRLGRWVNKGTKGIALLVDRDVPYKLRHVFDVSDTNSRAGRTVTLWQMRPQYEEAVVKACSTASVRLMGLQIFRIFSLRFQKTQLRITFQITSLI